MTKKKGFTLIELIVVIAIIAVLMLILVPTMNGFVEDARNEANQANAKAVYTAMIAQDTAAKSGLSGYNAIAATATGTDAKCNKAGLNDNLYEGAAEISDACTYTKSGSSIIVNWGNSKYPTE